MRTKIIMMIVSIVAANWGHAEGVCPPGFRDTGAHCLKPPSYGRGGGDTTLEYCELNHPGLGCEKCFEFYYPVCRASYRLSGCNMCTPVCPANMTDIGVSCQK